MKKAKHFSLRSIKAKQRRRQKLCDVKTEAWANTFAESLAEVKAETIGETLTAVTSASLVLKLAATLAEMNLKEVNKTLGDVETE